MKVLKEAIYTVTLSQGERDRLLGELRKIDQLWNHEEGELAHPYTPGNGSIIGTLYAALNCN